MNQNPLGAIDKIESDLWEAADQLRANSKKASSEYFMPVLGVIFLRHAAINTTNEFYLSIPRQRRQSGPTGSEELLGGLKGGDPTDPKLTPKHRKRAFPGRKQLKPLVEADELKRLG